MRTKEEQEYLLAAVDAHEREMTIVSRNFRILAANRKALTRYGQQMLGKTCHEIFYGRIDPCENCPHDSVVIDGKPVRKDRARHPIDIEQVTCFPITNQDNEIDAMVIMGAEHPRMGELEEQLARKNRILENMLDSAVDGIIAADMTGKLFIFNKAAVEVSGYTETEAIERVNIRQFYPEGVAYEIMRNMRSDGHGGKGKLKEYRVEAISKTGERIPISLNASIIYENGEEIGSIGFFHDLRERLRMKKELEKTQIQLYQSEKMASLGKLAAGVAHQINNPLGGITLYAKLILEEHPALPEDVQQDLNRILKDTQRCRATVKELLEFARQTRHFKKPMDLNHAIERTLFLVEGHTIFQNIDTVKDLSPALPPIKADAHQINHIIMNLIFNAAQAMEGRGRLTISTRLTENDTVTLTVADTGPGIPADVLPHIFEPFFTTKEEGKGTGLGLSLVYGIVENHSGTITAANAPEGGAVFTIKLPMDHVDHEGAAIETTAR